MAELLSIRSLLPLLLAAAVPHLAVAAEEDTPTFTTITTPQAGFNAPTALKLDTAAAPSTVASTSTKAPVPSATPSSSSPSTAASPSPPHGNATFQTGAIVIFVISGVVLMSLLVLGVILYLRRRSQRRHQRPSRLDGPFGTKGAGGLLLGSPGDGGKWARVAGEGPATSSRESFSVAGVNMVDIPREPQMAGLAAGHRAPEPGATARSSVSRVSSLGSLRSTDAPWSRPPPPHTALPPLPTDRPAAFDFGLPTEPQPTWPGPSRPPEWSRGGLPTHRHSHSNSSLWDPNAYVARDTQLL